MCRSYIGPYAVSEPETAAVKTYVENKLKNETVMAISFHSFGQVYFMPYAYGNGSEKKRPRHHPNLEVRLLTLLLIYCMIKLA